MDSASMDTPSMIPVLERPDAGQPAGRRAARPEVQAWRRRAITLGCVLGLLLPAIAQTQQAILEPLGTLTLPGFSSGNDLEVVGTRAYMADGDAGLRIIDIVDPAAPVHVGTFAAPGSVRGVQVVGNLAYLANVAAGLQVVDVSNPGAPVLVGTNGTPNGASAVHVVDGIAYVVDFYAGLQVISVTNPAAPVLLGGRDTPGVAFAVQVVGNFAFVGDDSTGLMVMDVSNPAEPVLRQTMAVSGLVTDLQVAGNLCFVTSDQGLTLFDVSTPTAPAMKAFVPHPGGFYKVSVSGRHAFVGRRFNGGLDVFDVGNPAAPRQVLQEAGNQVVMGLQAVGSRLHTATGAFRISNLRLGFPQSVIWPEALAGERLARNTAIELKVTASSGLPVTMRVTGPATVNAGTLTVTNAGVVALVSEQPGNEDYLPVRTVRRFNVPNVVATALGTYGDGGRAFGLQVVGHLAYRVGGFGGLDIVDFSNAAHPRRLGGVGATGVTSHVQVVGHLAYVADPLAGEVEVYDVTNPSAPVRRGYYSLLGASRVQVEGHRAYVVTHFGFVIVDMTDPSAPVQLGSYYTTGPIPNVHVVGNFAYLKDATAMFQVIDVADPAAPVLVGSGTAPGFARNVRVVGHLAYVAGDEAGLQIFDVADPAAPKLVGSHDTAGYAFDVEVVGHLAYVAAGPAGLQVIDISDPAAPVHLGGCNVPGGAVDIEVVGHLAYVAGDEGLHLLEVAVGLPQSLTFELPEAFTFDGRAVPLDGRSSEGLPLTYAVIQGPGTVVNRELVATGIGHIRMRVQSVETPGFLPAALDRVIRVGLPELRVEASGNGVDVTWAAGLNGLFLDGRESLDAKHPWQSAVLPWQEANGRIRVQAEASALRFFRLRGNSDDPDPPGP
jgi:hypothetical protein